MQLVLLGLLILACGGGADDTDPYSTGGDTGTSGTGSIEPMEGEWLSDRYSMVRDPCGVYNPSLPGDYFPESFDVFPGEAEDTFEMDGGGFTFECTVTGNGYGCATVESTLPVGYGMSATFVFQTTVTGVFQAEDRMIAKPNLDITCNGVDCGGVPAEFPCEMVLDVEASATGM